VLKHIHTVHLAMASAFLSFFSAPVVNAEIIQGEVGLVTRMRTYTTFGNGDVILYVQNPLAGCDGFWFRTSESNGREVFAQILVSEKTQVSLYLTAYDDQLWTGSAARFCKLYAVDTTSE
jgi:hypothetical protein